MIDSIVNKYGTEIRVGQTWADNDPRSKGRTIKVTALDLDTSKAICKTLTRPGGEVPEGRLFGRIHVDRLHPTGTGYRLREDEEGES